MRRWAARSTLPVGIVSLTLALLGTAGAVEVGDRRDLPPGAAASFGQIGTAAASAPNGDMVVFDGLVNGAPVDSTWVFDGTTWSHPCDGAGATPCGPVARQSPGMARAGGPGGAVFVFGGLTANFGGPGGSALGDTWRFNGTTWDPVCSTATCGPGARAAPAMAGDGSTAVMYGGFGSGPLDDGWRFDGVSWTQFCGSPLAACGPPPLLGATMLWTGSQFALFGGTTDFSTPNEDTWVLSGNAWTKVCGSGMSPCGPAGRALASAATVAGGGALMAGGLLLNGGTVLGAADVWRWDGSAWSQEAVPWDTDPFDFNASSFPACGPVFPVLATEGSGARIAGMFTQGTGGPGATITSFLVGSSVPAPLDRAGVCPAEAPTTTTTPVGTPSAPPAATGTDPSQGGTGRSTLPATGVQGPEDVVWLGIAVLLAGAGLVSTMRHRRPEELTEADELEAR